MNVAALSIDVQLLRDLQHAPREACVHSVFERVINVLVGEERLLTLACRGADDAPDSIVVDLGSWSGRGLSAGDRVRLHDSLIVLENGPTGGPVGGRVIALESARPWHGRLPAYAADTGTLRHHLPLALAHLARHGRGVGRGSRASGAATPLDAALAEVFDRHTQGLCDAIALGDMARVHDQVGRLVGLGPGLTPAGDDFLVGLLAALHLPDGHCAKVPQVAACIVECAGRQTHLISAAALRAAAHGRVRERVIGFCDALMSGSCTGLTAALERVMAIGSGSGSEIAAGVLAGLGLQLRAETPGMRRLTASATDGQAHAR